MKSATPLFVAGLCASLAAANPLDKRALVTEYEIVTVTATVTGYPPAQPTADAGSGGWSNWGGWQGGNGGSGGWGGDAAATTYAQPAPSTEAPASDAPAPSFNQGPGDSSSGWSSSPPPSAPRPTGVSSDYQQGILDSHNIHRANHSASDLAWDDKLAGIAAQIAASCVYAHDTSTGGGGYGQNIGAGSPPSDIPSMISDLMYNDEIGYYPGYGGEPDMSNFEKWGHFSQIVWKSTTTVGCATQYCPGGLANTGGGVSPYFTVCNYGPPGNFGGQYGANVLAPLGYPTFSI
jgi:uncharacterized protein YkwD